MLASLGHIYMIHNVPAENKQDKLGTSVTSPM